MSWRPELGWRTFGSGRGGRRKTFLNVMPSGLAPWAWHSLPWTLAVGLWSQGGVGLDEGCGTHQHHDPAVSFGTLEAIQSWATLKPTEDALVKPLPTSHPGPHVLSHIPSNGHRHLQVVRGGQILLCVLAVLWAPRDKTNTNQIRKEQKLKGQGDGKVFFGGRTPPAIVGSGDGEPPTGGRRARSKYEVPTCLAPCRPASLCSAGSTCSTHPCPALSCKLYPIPDSASNPLRQSG